MDPTTCGGKEREVSRKDSLRTASISKDWGGGNEMKQTKRLDRGPVYQICEGL